LVGLAGLKETLERWPEARVSVIGSRLWLQILQPGFWPQIDRVVVVEKRAVAAEVYELAFNEREGPAVWRRREMLAGHTLRREFKSGYGVVVNTRVDSPRQGFPAFLGGVPERWGAADGLARLIYNKRGSHYGKDPLLHERDVALLLMDEADGVISRDTSGLQSRIGASPRIAKWRKLGLPSPRSLSFESAHRITGEKFYFAVNPTSSRREKAWPSHAFRELLLKLRGEGCFQNIVPIVLGAPNETDWLKEVAGDDFRIVQPPTIGELFDVLAGAAFLLTNTSSVQFIAASTGTKTITLMGRARPEIWGPLGPDDEIVQGREPDGLESIFERERLAYEAILTEDVAASVRRMIAAEGKRGLK
jgi:ADP-heptose:LPS heptosyltransferase